jgi:hypothetical protein
MPRYLIERNFDPLDEELLEQVGKRSKELLDDHYPTIRWEHSHVVVDDAGNTKSFCIYEAPSPDVIRAHAGELGYHIIGNIYEIGGDVSPRDFAPA